MLRRIVLIATLFALCAAVPASATVWDAYGDFGIAANPNGAWTYGCSATLGGEFITFDFAAGDTGYCLWTRNMGAGPDYSPYMFQNYGDIMTSYAAHSLVYSSGDPGQDEYAIVRWTAPEAGLYQIDASFKRMVGSSGPNVWLGRMDNHVLVNGASVFDCVVNQYDEENIQQPGPFTFSGIYSLAAGATVDFTGGTYNGSPASDFTDVTGSKITGVVPEPSSILALLAGMGGFVGLLRKRS